MNNLSSCKPMYPTTTMNCSPYTCSDNQLLSKFSHIKWLFLLQKMNCDFYILPSIIHEVLLLPKEESEGDISELNLMIHDVNATQVQEEEILSDHVYCYERRSGFISIPAMHEDSGRDSYTLPLSSSMRSLCPCPETSNFSTLTY